MQKKNEPRDSYIFRLTCIFVLFIIHLFFCSIPLRPQMEKIRKNKKNKVMSFFSLLAMEREKNLNTALELYENPSQKE